MNERPSLSLARHIDADNDWTDDPECRSEHLRKLCDALWRHQEAENFATLGAVIVACHAVAGTEWAVKALDKDEAWAL